MFRRCAGGALRAAQDHVRLCSQSAPVSSGLFEGVGPQPPQAAGQEPRQQGAPPQRPQPSESAPAAPRPAPESRPADTSRSAGTAPSAVAPTPPPDPTRATNPAGSAPPPPEPRIRYPGPLHRGRLPAQPRLLRPRPGGALQQQAMEYKRNGQKEQAIASFRKAIDAFRRDDASEGGGFEAQQGIRHASLS